MKVWKTIVVFCLSFILLLSFSVSTGFAEDEQILAESENPSIEAERLYEIEELREINSKTYQLSDGNCEYVAYAEDIHYKDADGNLKEINNEISDKPSKEGYTYCNTANAWHTYFADSLYEKDAIVIEKNNHRITFSMVGAQVQSKATKSSSLNKSDSIFDEMLANDNRTVVYKNALQNVDISYTVRTSGLKEDIILRDISSPNEFEFYVTTDGLSIIEKEGSVSFVNSEGQNMFQLAPMYMEDAGGKYSDKVDYTIEENDGGYIIKIIADKDFLNASDTKYPVIIDPSVMITGSSVTFDSCVDQQYPTSNYYLSQNLWTGGLYGTNAMRTFIKFTLPTNIAARNITSAYLRIEKNAYSTPGIKAYRVTGNWASSSITWNNQPGYTTTYASTTASNDSGYWYRMYTTTMVKKWIDGVYNNYGFVLKEPSESNTNQKTRFYSSDAPSPHKPELHIVYSIPTANYVSIKKATDRTFREEYPSYTTKIDNYISAIDDPFIATWNINFTHYAWRSFTTLPAYDCSYDHNVECNGGCGNSGPCGTRCANDTSTPNHHKNHYRNFYLAENGVGSADIQLSFFGFNPCSAGGLSRGDYSTIACPDLSYWSDTYIKRSIQHEVSHLFGCHDSSCSSGQDCIMSGGFDNKPFGQTDIWCESCESDFNRTAQ